MSESDFAGVAFFVALAAPRGAYQPVEELFESFNGLPLLSEVFQKDPSGGQSPPEPPPKHAAPLTNEVLQRAAIPA